MDIVYLMELVAIAGLAFAGGVIAPLAVMRHAIATGPNPGTVAAPGRCLTCPHRP